MTIRCSRCRCQLSAGVIGHDQHIPQVVVPTHLDNEGQDCPLGGLVLGIGYAT